MTLPIFPLRATRTAPIFFGMNSWTLPEKMFG